MAFQERKDFERKEEMNKAKMLKAKKERKEKDSEQNNGILFSIISSYPIRFWKYIAFRTVQN